MSMPALCRSAGYEEALAGSSCTVCGDTVHHDAVVVSGKKPSQDYRRRPLSDSLPFSGRSAAELLSSVFCGTLNVDFKVEDGGGVMDHRTVPVACGVCFGLIEEVDAFERSLQTSRSKLLARRPTGATAVAAAAVADLCRSGRVKEEAEDDDAPSVEPLRSLELFPASGPATSTANSKKNHRPKAPAVPERVSRKSSKVLSVFEKYMALMDQCLFAPANDQEPGPDVENQGLMEKKFAGAFGAISLSCKQTLQTQLELLQTLQMPAAVDDVVLQRAWDMVLFRVGSGRLSFGIPGELKCIECGREFRRVADRQAHALEEHWSGRGGKKLDARPLYFCGACDLKGSNSSNSISSHSSSSSSSSLPAEDRAFWSESKARKHVNSHHPMASSRSSSAAGQPAATSLLHMEPDVVVGGDREDRRCPFCPLVCSTEYAYWFHLNQGHRTSGDSKCPACHMAAPDVTALRRHILLVHAKYAYRCPWCPDKSFGTATGFQNHLKYHQRRSGKQREGQQQQQGASVMDGTRGTRRPELVRCELCDRSAFKGNHMARHMLRMHGVRMAVPCPVCRQVCEDPVALEKHKKADHSRGYCHICGKSFFQKADLRKHIAHFHQPESSGEDSKGQGSSSGGGGGQPGAKKAFMCEVCSMSFSRLSYLRIHKAKHREKEMRCTKCPKVFRWKSSLDHHMVVAHDMGVCLGGNNKPFACEFCNKGFADKSNLKNHRFTHMDEKPHTCSACGKGFIRKDLLRSHHRKPCTDAVSAAAAVVHRYEMPP